jgi:hypothetical protein
MYVCRSWQNAKRRCVIQIWFETPLNPSATLFALVSPTLEFLRLALGYRVSIPAVCRLANSCNET